MRLFYNVQLKVVETKQVEKVAAKTCWFVLPTAASKDRVLSRARFAVCFLLEPKRGGTFKTIHIVKLDCIFAFRLGARTTLKAESSAEFYA